MANLNIHFGVVLYEPGTESTAEVSGDEEKDMENEQLFERHPFLFFPAMPYVLLAVSSSFNYFCVSTARFLRCLAANVDFSTRSHVVRFMLELAEFLGYRCEFSFIIFFNLLYYSYAMCL